MHFWGRQTQAQQQYLDGNMTLGWSKTSRTQVYGISIPMNWLINITQQKIRPESVGNDRGRFLLLIAGGEQQAGKVTGLSGATKRHKFKVTASSIYKKQNQQTVWETQRPFRDEEATVGCLM